MEDAAIRMGGAALGTQIIDAIPGPSPTKPSSNIGEAGGVIAGEIVRHGTPSANSPAGITQDLITIMEAEYLRHKKLQDLGNEYSTDVKCTRCVRCCIVFTKWEETTIRYTMKIGRFGHRPTEKQIETLLQNAKSVCD